MQNYANEPCLGRWFQESYPILINDIEQYKRTVVAAYLQKP